MRGIASAIIRRTTAFLRLFFLRTPIANQSAYAVLVNLDALARRLSRKFQEPCDEMGAGRWLTMGRTFKREHSPFAQTAEEPRVFYCEEDPTNYLAINEIETYHVTAKRARDKFGNLFPVLE